MSAYRDNHARFADASAHVLGVSMDSLETQKRFAESLKLPFELLADPGGKAARAYGVHGLLFTSRTTFVINEDGVIAAIIEGRDAIDPSSALSACQKKTP
jgi:peroxiredoxin Q/BCP